MNNKGKSKPIILAKLVATKKDGSKLIVEVHKDSTFQKFYFWYTQEGNTRKKILVRTSSRIADIQPPHMAARIRAGLHLILIRLKGNRDIDNIFIKVIKKKLYRKYVVMAPDQFLYGLPRNAPSVLEGQAHGMQITITPATMHRISQKNRIRGDMFGWFKDKADTNAH